MVIEFPNAYYYLLYVCLLQVSDRWLCSVYGIKCSAYKTMSFLNTSVSAGNEFISICVCPCIWIVHGFKYNDCLATGFCTSRVYTLSILTMSIFCGVECGNFTMGFDRSAFSSAGNITSVGVIVCICVWDWRATCQAFLRYSNNTVYCTT